MWGQKIDFYEGVVNEEMPEFKTFGDDAVERLIIEQGFRPQSDPLAQMPVDAETATTISDMQQSLTAAQKSQDFELCKQLEADLKAAQKVGVEIAMVQSEIKGLQERPWACRPGHMEALQQKQQGLEQQREALDVKYETRRYEDMVCFGGESAFETRKQEEAAVVRSKAEFK